MKPIKIRKESENIILIIWDSGKETRFTLKQLRDECPCATCKGETILFKTYTPNKSDIELPGKYELKSIVPIGNYAIQLIWGDGHDTGLYSWEYLLSLTET
ncbi:MAG TPA: DUF971 domain-containing protein [Ignavibacteria bacterium]